ncbi:biotin synthase BioB [Sphingoaurantiacus capsulatus]|uniref:Biotin synthase n=1 Tax=Sphingoaurantiacus capsulatus TaxID=1771310 RepID=A0ABV7XDZ7_9SPHN
MTSAHAPRHDWTLDEARALFARPLNDLVFEAQAALRAHFDPHTVQTSQLLSIKTGGCAENCGYCSQSAHFNTGVKATKLSPMDEVITAARDAKANGASRFCMGAAWRSLKDRDVERLCGMVAEVKAMGLETCVTAGMLEDGQAEKLRAAGLDYYNHNLDTGRDYYAKVVTTRTYEDRLDTLAKARDAGLKLCCGGIVGMGESLDDQLGLFVELAALSPHPESVPINRLVPIAGTPLAGSAPVDDIDTVRLIAVARLMLPSSYVRLSAGREAMSREMQALCLLAGANSFFVGGKLLTTPNAGEDEDSALLRAMGFVTEAPRVAPRLEAAE